MRFKLATAFLLRKTTYAFPSMFVRKGRFSQQQHSLVAFKRAIVEKHSMTANSEESSAELLMENLYKEWTLEDDVILYENRSEPIPKLASILGRGLRGVSMRLNKLKDVNSNAYSRLFVGERMKSSAGAEAKPKDKLTPAIEIMRRIKWDFTLTPNDFEVFYYDRVEDKILNCSFDEVNNSVKGKETQFVFAIPEHRITVRKILKPLPRFYSFILQS